MKTIYPSKRINTLLLLCIFYTITNAQIDPVLQQENISGTNTINKLRTVLDWSGLASSSAIPTSGAITNNGQIVTTAATGFQYQINYVRETGYTSLGSTTTAFKFDYSTSGTYGTGTAKQAALNYGAVCGSLQIAQVGTYRMEVSNTAGGAIPLQFSLVDLDQSEQIQIEGYAGGTYIAATLKLRSVLATAPVITHNATNEQVKASINTNKADFLETSVVDVFFLTPVDKIVIRQTNNAAGNGFTLVTNLKAISSVDVVKSAGVVNTTAYGSPTTYSVPYTIEVINKETRGLTLNDIQVSENLNIPFPMPPSSGVVIKPATLSVTAPAASGIAINSAFDGITNFGLLNGTGTLKPGESAIIQFTVLVSYPSPASVPLTQRDNQVYASGLPYNSAGNTGGTYPGSKWTGPVNSVSVDSSTNSATVPAVANGDIPDPTPVFFFTIPLSVRLTDFAGKLVQNHSELSWITASETGNDYFIIEKSKDGIVWQQAGTIASKGNNSSLQTYTFTDSTPFKNISYYRLKQIDISGSFTYSTVIFVSANKSIVPKVGLYPNPAVNNLSVVIKNAKPGNKIISLYNNSGALLSAYNRVTQGDYDQYTLPNISLLQNGTYVLVIKEPQGNVLAVEKFIKK
jgi:Secretion system C-terminal sorting domain